MWERLLVRRRPDQQNGLPEITGQAKRIVQELSEQSEAVMVTLGINTHPPVDEWLRLVMIERKYGRQYTTATYESPRMRQIVHPDTQHQVSSHLWRNKFSFLTNVFNPTFFEPQHDEDRYKFLNRSDTGIDFILDAHTQLGFQPQLTRSLKFRIATQYGHLVGDFNGMVERFGIREDGRPDQSGESGDDPQLGPLHR
jgi:hypothetical protein